MAEGNSSNINQDGASTEQPASGQTNIPSALTATRDSIPWLKNKFIRSVFNVIMVLLICAALYSIYVFTRHADPAEVFIFSAARYSPDKPFTLLVLARDAKNELPLDNQSIDLFMWPRDKDKEFRKLPSVKTGRDGIALVSIPPCPAGDYQIKAVVRDLAAISNIEVKSVYKAMLTSDKPMYQPGQTIHLRSLTLNTTDLHPAPENNVNFKIHDPNGNLVLDQTAKSS
ncbi:MAG: MG2 domain-containing protein, partial [Victivallaceae bacterium]